MILVNLHTDREVDVPVVDDAADSLKEQYKAWEKLGIIGPFKPTVKEDPQITLYLPKHARIRNILLFDTFVAIDEEPYEVPHDDADEFLFDVGGEADIFSCKALFATDTEIKCVYKDFFDAEKCRPIWYYKTDYLPSSASGPNGCECAFEERIMSCDGGNLCL